MVSTALDHLVGQEAASLNRFSAFRTTSGSVVIHIGGRLLRRKLP